MDGKEQVLEGLRRDGVQAGGWGVCLGRSADSSPVLAGGKAECVKQMVAVGSSSARKCGRLF